ncbi:hypothetical protein AGABI2DRAFT_117208 [Agaricus bisporus var. bisporus H97]|uniref:hypothetical protein n=1 Tax=Agaricus bisporus var. bisporus (strain H97 / ATCC MYA-4626 / FGSC 10389) TaxID=936046 RepID=UPI00029F5492|nr:hypothetical protein AGABI2DRAFT_117208 [Agaricus bisporus var. bisporus H97]EKV48385.1 hypothetical protein AGABI2DRAFT_117208 [Agaricus bisporus var. bisporus H97]
MSPIKISKCSDTIYIVLDTNILLHHLHILKNLVEDIVAASAPITLICPGIVLNELDFQKNQSHIGRLARNATDWMMREVSRKDLPKPIVKGQAQQETCKSTKNWKVREKGEAPVSNDEVILDCCSYFHSNAPTIMYTGDKNLCLRCSHEGEQWIKFKFKVSHDDIEGLLFILPPPSHEYTSRDLVKYMQGVLPEYQGLLESVIESHRQQANNGKKDDGMMIDEDLQAEVVPRATLVHNQVIERFVPQFRALVQRVGGDELVEFENKKKSGVSVSKYAPRWQQNDRPVGEWEVGDCLEYLQNKKKINFTQPEPPLERFLRYPYSGNGALSGAEWSASAWKAAGLSLRQVGEAWKDEAMLQDVELFEQYLKAEYS